MYVGIPHSQRKMPNGAVDALKKELTRRISKRYDNVEVLIKATSNDGLSVTRTETLKDTWESADEWFVH
ncbi:DinI-like family protein [Escherichia coli]